MQVQVGKRCNSRDKRGVSVSTVERSQGKRRMTKACGMWKIPWNTPYAARLA